MAKSRKRIGRKRARPKHASPPPTNGRATPGNRLRSRNITARRGRPKAVRVAAIIAELHRLYPEADCALTHRSAWELLVSTILSAQCTDERVNRVTPDLFRRYPSIAALAKASPLDIESIIKSTGFFRNKARNLLGAAKTIVASYAGDVPETMDELLQLPGVARKTANVVLGTWFKKNDGVVVDTHIGRLSQRLGLTWRSKDDKDAKKIEQDLMEVVPRDDWTFVGHALIWHGRRVCTARKPNCMECALNKLCPSAFKFGSAKPNSRRIRLRQSSDTRRSID